jgi:hypothetical protein
MFTFATQHKQNELQRRLNFKYSMVEIKKVMICNCKNHRKMVMCKNNIGKGRSEKDLKRENILGWTTRNHLKEPKTQKSFS